MGNWGSGLLYGRTGMPLLQARVRTTCCAAAADSARCHGTQLGLPVGRNHVHQQRSSGNNHVHQQRSSGNNLVLCC
jgi:hypothetical protein